MTKKYIEWRTLNLGDLRALCIQNNWYDLGDNKEYMNLFAKLFDDGFPANLTTDKLAEIAEDIWEHTSLKPYGIEAVMFLLNATSVTQFREA